MTSKILIYLEFLLYFDDIGASLNWLASLRKSTLNLVYDGLSESVDEK